MTLLPRRFYSPWSGGQACAFAPGRSSDYPRRAARSRAALGGVADPPNPASPLPDALQALARRRDRAQSPRVMLGMGYNNSGALMLQSYTTLGWKGLARIWPKAGRGKNTQPRLASPRERSDAHSGGTRSAVRAASPGERDRRVADRTVARPGRGLGYADLGRRDHGLAGGGQHDAERQRRGSQAAAGALLCRTIRDDEPPPTLARTYRPLRSVAAAPWEASTRPLQGRRRAGAGGAAGHGHGRGLRHARRQPGQDASAAARWRPASRPERWCRSIRAARSIGWATPASTALKVAVVATVPAPSHRLPPSQGIGMIGGYIAPGRRVGYYLPAANALTESGWRLLDNAVAHAAGLAARWPPPPRSEVWPSPSWASPGRRSRHGPGPNRQGAELREQPRRFRHRRPSRPASWLLGRPGDALRSKVTTKSFGSILLGIALRTPSSGLEP